MRNLSWQELLEQLAKAIDRGAQREKTALWSEVERRLWLSADMNALARYGWSKSDVEHQIGRLMSEIKQGLLAGSPSPLTDISRWLQEKARDSAQRVMDLAQSDGSLEPLDHVQRVMLALPEEDQQMIRMRFWEELGPSGIAKELGISFSEASGRLFRALAHLRAQINIRQN